MKTGSFCKNVNNGDHRVDSVIVGILPEWNLSSIKLTAMNRIKCSTLLLTGFGKSLVRLAAMECCPSHQKEAKSIKLVPNG